MKLDQATLEATITDGKDHTYASLCSSHNADDAQKMQIDRTLQKLRRKGEIEMRREGRVVIWTKVNYTPPAKAAA